MITQKLLLCLIKDLAKVALVYPTQKIYTRFVYCETHYVLDYQMCFTILYFFRNYYVGLPAHFIVKFYRALIKVQNAHSTILIKYIDQTKFFLDLDKTESSKGKIMYKCLCYDCFSIAHI